MEPTAKPICGLWGEELLTVRKTANYQNKFTSDKISFMEWPDKRLYVCLDAQREKEYISLKKKFLDKSSGVLKLTRVKSRVA